MEDIQAIIESLKTVVSSKTLSFEDYKKSFEEFLKSSDTVLTKLYQLSEVHKKGVVEVEEQRRVAEKAVADLKTAHANELFAHGIASGIKQEHLKGLEASIKDSELKVEALDRRAQGLATETRELEGSSTSLRGQISTLERAVRTLQTEEAQLTGSVTVKKDEEAKLLTSIEASKKEYAQVSSELKTLESRK